MSRLYRIAKNWNTEKITDEERSELKAVIAGVVGYPCKIACDYEDGLVDIHVFSESAGRVVDWLDMQPNGALSLLEDMYCKKKRTLNKELASRCANYNADNELDGDDDEEDDEDDSDYEDEDEDEDDEDEDEDEDD